jgi:hypothetical protein
MEKEYPNEKIQKVISEKQFSLFFTSFLDLASITSFLSNPINIYSAYTHTS